MAQSRLMFLAAIAAAGPLSAQEPPRTGGIEEITVTAQRREQSLQDVPLAITAFSGDQLAQRQIVDTYDLVRNIPNLTGNANVGVGTSSSYYIRGIGNAESIATFDVPVGTYVDDVYISRQNHNNFALFDVERIEVLRGPQGTLFGRNTTGGAINVVMKKPSQELKGFVEGGTGRFGLWSLRGSIDVPVSDRFLTKFSAYGLKDDGYAEQVSTGIEFNDRDGEGLRADLRFLATDRLTLDFVGEHVKDRNTNFLNVVDANGHRVVNNKLLQGALVGTFTGRKATLAPGNEARTNAVTLNVKYEFTDSIALTSISGWRKTDHEFLIDSGGDLPRVSTTRGFTPLANIGEHEQWSQEFKLNGDTGNLNWVAGLYYLKEDNVTDFANANTALPSNVFSVAADRTMLNGLKTYAVYGQGDWKFADRWTLTTGLRFTNEKKDFSIERNPGALGANLNMAAIVAAGTPTELEESVWTPRLAIQYDLDPNVMFFASATRGFKSGGWPARATANNAFLPFKPEKVWSYEVGSRADLFDRRLRMNVTAFYSVTSDVQIPARVDFNGVQISTTTNPADLENYGLEIDAEWMPVEKLSITTGIGLQNAKYVSFAPNVLAQAAACRANPSALFQGAPACNANFVDQFGQIATPVRAPDFTMSMDVSYKGADLGAVRVSPTVGFNYSAPYAIGTTGSSASTNGTWSRSQLYVNAGVTLEFPSLPGLSITADCRNCADKAYPMSALGPFQFLDRPGSYGIRARYRF